VLLERFRYCRLNDSNAESSSRNHRRNELGKFSHFESFNGGSFGFVGSEPGKLQRLQMLRDTLRR